MRLKKNPPPPIPPPLFSEWVRSLLNLCYGRSIETATRHEKWFCAILALRLRRQATGGGHSSAEPGAPPAVTVHFILDPFDPFRLASGSLLSDPFEEDLSAELNAVGFSVDDLNPFRRHPNGGLTEPELFWIDWIHLLSVEPGPFDIAALAPRYRMIAQATPGAEHPLLFPERIDSPFAPLLMEAPETAEPVSWGGQTRHFFDAAGKYSVRWEGAETIRAQPRKLDWIATGCPPHRPITFWESAAPTGPGAAQRENDPAALEAAQAARDCLSHWTGDTDTELSPQRLMRLHFLVSAALQKSLRQAWAHNPTPAGLAAHRFHFASPATGLGLAEFLRLLLDEYHLAWDDAWDLAQKNTRVSLLEAPAQDSPTVAVKWLEAFLPRHLEIIYEANRRHLEHVAEVFRGDLHQLRRLSVVEEGPDKKLRLRHWCLLAAGTGEVSAPFESDQDPAWNLLSPGRLKVHPQGINLPLVLQKTNPNLTALISDAIGTEWMTRPEELSQLKKFAQDRGFQEAWMTIKADHKTQTARDLQSDLGYALDPTSLWEVYPASFRMNNRHLLLLLEILSRYLQLRESLDFSPPPRTVFLLGTFDPRETGEFALVKLALHLQQLINTDPLTTDRLRLFTLLNPNSDLVDSLTRSATQCDVLWAPGHETFSTAWIRYLFNGAWILSSKARHLSQFTHPPDVLTFGEPTLAPKGHHPRGVVAGNETLRNLLENLNRGLFPPGQTVFKPLLQHLFEAQDPYRVLLDFAAFNERQKDIDRLYVEPGRGWPMVLNQLAQGADLILHTGARLPPEKKRKG
jgi:starch phosphorylase